MIEETTRRCCGALLVFILDDLEAPRSVADHVIVVSVDVQDIFLSFFGKLAGCVVVW